MFPTKAGFREDKKAEKRRSVGGCGGLDGSHSSGGSSVALLRGAQHERFVDSEGESQYGCVDDGRIGHSRSEAMDFSLGRLQSGLKLIANGIKIPNVGGGYG
jgi:hypothetical protein